MSAWAKSEDTRALWYIRIIYRKADERWQALLASTRALERREPPAGAYIRMY